MRVSLYTRPVPLSRCCVALVLVSSLASAQSELSGSSSGPSPAPQIKKHDETWQARAQYGIVSRSGALSDSGPGLTYSGITPNDLSLRGWLWLLAGGLGIGCAIAFVIVLLSDGDPGGPATGAPPATSGMGFGAGLALGVGIGIAVGFAVARQLVRDHSSRSNP